MYDASAGSAPVAVVFGSVVNYLLFHSKWFHNENLTHRHDYSTNCQNSKNPYDKFISIWCQEGNVEATRGISRRLVDECFELLFQVHGTIEDLAIVGLCASTAVIHNDLGTSLPGQLQESRKEDVVG